MSWWWRRLDRAELGGVLVLAGMLLVASALPLAVSFAVSPEDIESGRVVLSPPCPYRAAHDQPCPACGLTRAFTALSRGRLADARRYNPSSLALYATFLAVALASGSAFGLTARRLGRHRPAVTASLSAVRTSRRSQTRCDRVAVRRPDVAALTDGCDRVGDRPADVAAATDPL